MAHTVSLTSQCAEWHTGQPPSHACCVCVHARCSGTHLGQIFRICRDDNSEELWRQRAQHGGDGLAHGNDHFRVRCVLKLLHDDRVDLLHKPAEQVKPVKGEAKRPQEDMVGFGVEGRFAELPQRECSQASAAGRVPHLSRARCRSVPEGGCQESEAAPPHAAEAAATDRRRAGRELFCRLTASRPAPRLGKRAQAAARQAWRRAETACAPRLEGAQWRANSAMRGCFWRRGLSCGSDGCVWLRLQVVGHAPNARLWKTPPAATPASGIRCDDAQGAPRGSARPGKYIIKNFMVGDWVVCSTLPSRPSTCTVRAIAVGSLAH